MKTYKTKLKLNNKQKTLFFKNASVARFAYNLTLGIEQENYKEGNKFLSDCGVRKLITQRKKDKEDLCDSLKLYGFKVKEIPIDDRSHLFENAVNLLISW